MPPKQTDAENGENPNPAEAQPPAEATGGDSVQAPAEPATAEPAPVADAITAADPAAQPEPAAAPVENPLEDLGQAPIRHPQGATSCSYDGVTYEADPEGIIIVPLAAFEVLRDHGFVLAVV